MFHPSNEEIENVIYYAKFFENVVVVDNTDSHSLVDFSEYQNINLLSSGVNLGLAKALNLFVKHSKSLGIKYCCILDQDSKFDISSIQNMIDFIYKKQLSNIAIYSPKIIYQHTLKIKDAFDDLDEYEYIDWAITSGSFINTDYFDLIGGFDERYFIDRLEMDYCYKASLLEKKIVKVNSVRLHQQLGKCRRILWVSIYEHSPIRNYYIFRNRLLFYLKVNKGNCILNRLKVIALSIRQIVRVAFFEKEKMKKFIFISRAISDYFTGRLYNYESS